LGYEVDEDLPWHSTISRTRQLYPVTVFEHLFDQVFGQCVAAGLVAGDTQAVDSALRQLRALSRERQSLTQQAVRLKAQRHAYQHSYQPDARTLDRLSARHQLLDQQIKAVDQDIIALLQAELELARELAQLTSIPGIGQTTAVAVVAETNGFVLVENERQLASYAGLDVVQRQSGLSAGATRISRCGNVRLRTALYLPAVSSLRYNPQQVAFYTRLRARQPNGKPGVIAVMRKLLLLCYALWKKGLRL
jgi:transposase